MLQTQVAKTPASLEEIATAIPLALIVSDVHGRIEIVNSEAEALLGLPAGELVGQPVDGLITDAQDAGNPGLPADSCSSGTYKRLRDGRSIPLEVQTSVVSFGPETHNLHRLTDLASQRLAEDLEQRMAALVESADDAIITKTLDGIIRTWNPAAERLLGYTAAEIIGESITRLIPDDRQDEEGMIIHQIQQGKRVSHFETLRQRKDGTPVEVSLMISPILDRKGTVVGASKIMRDLTNRRSTERELRHSNGELEQRNAELNDFVQAAAHDLRAPLLSAESAIDWILEEDCGLSAETRQRLRLVQQRMERMTRLLGDIREHARLGRSDKPSGRVTPASALVGEIVSHIDVPKGFTVSCDPSLHSAMVAHTPLERVLDSLIINALRHHDLETGRISVAVTSSGGYYRFSVTDDGPGIPEESRESVFEMFQTLSPRHEAEGSGIGLALVRKIVSRMGGACGVSPAEPRGCCFWFDWPRLPDSSAR